MRLMRNVNVHASTFNTSNHKSNVLMCWDDPPTPLTISVVIINNLSVDELLRKRDARRHYSRPDLVRIVDWFMEKQRVFGASHIFGEGVEALCREILLLYSAPDTMQS